MLNNQDEKKSKVLSDSDLDNIVGGAEYADSSHWKRFPEELFGYMLTEPQNTCGSWMARNDSAIPVQECFFCKYFGANNKWVVDLGARYSTNICVNSAKANR